MDKIQLFYNTRQRLFALLIFIVLILLKVAWLYHTFTTLKQSFVVYTKAAVLKQYTKTKKLKNNRYKSYTVLKLKSSKGFSFYTTSNKILDPLKNVSLKIFFKNVSFMDFLSGFYAPSFDIIPLKQESNLRSFFLELINAQHQDKSMANLFQALFLAEALKPTLRDQINKYGLAHLFALSGYHLSFLLAILMFLLVKPYSFLQQRYFPYRNRYFDLSIFCAFLLAFYLFISQMPPSLVRAYVMLCIALLFYFHWIKILSFETLCFCIATVAILALEYIFSVAFWFSISGVFYIYLFLHHFRHLHYVKLAILLNCFVFIAMMPLVHYFFGIFTFYQLLSPVFTLAFAVFYPISIILHLIGFGGMMDPYLKSFLVFEMNIYNYKTSLWILIICLLSSIAAIFDKRLFVFFLFFLLIFCINLIVQITNFNLALF